MFAHLSSFTVSKQEKYEEFPQVKVIILMTIKSKIQTINYGISAINPIFGGG